MVGSQADTTFDTKFHCIQKGANQFFAGRISRKKTANSFTASLVLGLALALSTTVSSATMASATEPDAVLNGFVQQNFSQADAELGQERATASHILLHDVTHKNVDNKELLAAAAIAAPSISNFDIVSAGLWRGAAPSNQAMKKLAESGVKTIVDLRLTGQGAAEEASTAKKLGIKYIHLPLGFMGPSLLKVAQFLNIVNEPSNQPVFVHCRYGADRTGALVAVFRVIHDHWSFNQAYSEMRKHHFKPWLASLKRMVARVGDDEAVQKELKVLAGKNLATL